jgi:hypothetical protein
MSDEDYESRKGTLRDWAKKQKAADSSFTLKKHADQHAELVKANKYYKEVGELPPGFSFVDGKMTKDKVEGEEVRARACSFCGGFALQRLAKSGASELHAAQSPSHAAPRARSHWCRRARFMWRAPQELGSRALI